MKLFIPLKKTNINYKKNENLEIKFIKTKTLLNENKKNLLKFIYKKIKQKIILYFYGELEYEFSKLLKKELSMEKAKEKIQGVISIGLPFSVIEGTSKWLKEQKNIVSIADYGDPFYNQNYKKINFVNFYREKIALKNYSYITIPTEAVITSFIKYKNIEKIKIIPQGFNFKNVELQEFKRNRIPIFAYSGIFYKKIRDPKLFLDILSKIDKEFKFVMYIPENQVETFNLTYYINKMPNKIIIKKFVKRLELIKELSKMDFLVNLENGNCNQIPSKLIDYALTKRPILSIPSTNPNKKDIEDFIEGNFVKSKKIDLEKYNIEKITDDFLKLLEGK